MECKDEFYASLQLSTFFVGECGRIGTGRREIGHVNWHRAINSSLPLKENFYTLRVVSQRLQNVVRHYLDGCWRPIKNQ